MIMGAFAPFYFEVLIMATTKKAATKKKQRVDVFTRTYFDVNGGKFPVGSVCKVEDTDELERLTKMGVIKSEYQEV